MLRIIFNRIVGAARALQMGGGMINLISTQLPETPDAACSVAGMEQHREYLFHNALGRLRDREAAEDAVQESFLAAFQSSSGFSKRATERTWLTGILKHKVCDHMRRACRDRAVFESATLTEHDEFDTRALDNCASTRNSDAGTHLERKELGEAIEQAIERLPGRLAKVFRLYECDDYSGHEVCDELGISENNLWIMLHRARKQLQKELLPWRAAATC
jgi:RNA polymerase sigma-70 factor (ECF subfamily)